MRYLFIGLLLFAGLALLPPSVLDGLAISAGLVVVAVLNWPPWLQTTLYVAIAAALIWRHGWNSAVDQAYHADIEKAEATRRQRRK